MKSEAKANTTMTCEACEVNCQRFGKHRNGLRRFRCPQCKKTYTEAHKPALEGSYISLETIVLALRLLVEGNCLRSTERITGLDINTLMKILVKAGEKCEKLMGRLIVNVPVTDVECDEIWAFVERRKATSDRQNSTMKPSVISTASSPSSGIRKLVLNFALGRRTKPPRTFSSKACAMRTRAATSRSPRTVSRPT